MGLLIPDAEDEVQGGTPESADENPTADDPEEADAILAAPSPSAASLLLNPLPLLGVESSPRLFTEPAFSGPPPRPLSQIRRAGSGTNSGPHHSAGMGENSRLAPSPQL